VYFYRISEHILLNDIIKFFNYIEYRKSIITKEIGTSLKEICLKISERYEIHFVEIGYESYYVIFWVQSVLKLNISKIARTIKNITAKQLFQRHHGIEAKLWKSSF
jgi:putative transposase